jgi:hypothetical protein
VGWRDFSLILFCLFWDILFGEPADTPYLLRTPECPDNPVEKRILMNKGDLVKALLGRQCALSGDPGRWSRRH